MLFIRPDIGKPFVFALVNYVDIRCHDAEQRSVRGDFRGCDSEPTRSRGPRGYQYICRTTASLAYATM